MEKPWSGSQLCLPLQGWCWQPCCRAAGPEPDPALVQSHLLPLEQLPAVIFVPPHSLGTFGAVLRHFKVLVLNKVLKKHLLEINIRLLTVSGFKLQPLPHHGQWLQHTPGQDAQRTQNPGKANVGERGLLVVKFPQPLRGFNKFQ